MDNIGASNGGDWETMKLFQAKLLPKGLDLLFQLQVALLVLNYKKLKSLMSL